MMIKLLLDGVLTFFFFFNRDMGLVLFIVCACRAHVQSNRPLGAR